LPIFFFLYSSDTPKYSSFICLTIGYQRQKNNNFFEKERKMRGHKTWNFQKKIFKKFQKKNQKKFFKKISKKPPPLKSIKFPIQSLFFYQFLKYSILYIH